MDDLNFSGRKKKMDGLYLLASLTEGDGHDAMKKQAHLIT